MPQHPGDRQPPWRETIPPRRTQPHQTPPDVDHGAPSQHPQRAAENPQEAQRATKTPTPAQLATPHTHVRSGGPQDANDPITVEHSTPLWRLVGVVLAAAAVGVLCWWLRIVDRLDDAAMLLATTTVGMIHFWSRRQRGAFRRRLGPFHRIGMAILESREDIDHWADRRSLAAGFYVAIGAALGLLLLKHLFAFLLGWLASPWLAGALGCAIGAAVIAPELWRSAGRRLAGH